MSARAAVVLTMAFAIASVGVGSACIQMHTENKTLKVASKERLLQVDSNADGKASSTYKNFVYTDDEAYVVQDSFWNFHFTSGTVYAKIKEGATCDVTVAGYRFGFLSMYQNIIKAECRV